MRPDSFQADLHDLLTWLAARGQRPRRRRRVPLLELTRPRLNLTWVCLRDDLNTEFFVEPQDLRCFESLSRPDERWMTRLWFVAVPEHAFVAAGREHEQHPCAVDARVLEAVPGASRDEDEIARAGDEGACPVEDLELAGENIEGFVGSGVDMGDRSAARRHRGVDQSERAVRGLARCLDRVSVTSEPRRRTFTCGNMDGSACAVSRVLGVVELI